MKKLFFLFAFLGAVLFSNAIQAQEYNSAIGLRLGYPLSVSYKKFLNESNALEVFAGYRGYSFYNWFSVGAAYQIHKPINGVDGLQWYFGGGASAFFYNYDNGFDFGDSGSFGIGIQGNLGLDYKFDSAPINISADWMPTIFIGNGYLSGFGGGYGALSVRYTLN